MNEVAGLAETVTKCSCERPSIVTMDYDKATPSKKGPYVLARRINRVCTRCWAHWFGAPGKVKRFTKAEWDEWVEAA